MTFEIFGNGTAEISKKWAKTQIFGTEIPTQPSLVVVRSSGLHLVAVPKLEYYTLKASLTAALRLASARLLWML